MQENRHITHTPLGNRFTIYSLSALRLAFINTLIKPLSVFLLTLASISHNKLLVNPDQDCSRKTPECTEMSNGAFYSLGILCNL